MKVKELITLLKTEDPDKNIRLDVHTGDSIHKIVNVLTDSVTSVKGEKEAVWICYKPDHIENVYSASGFATLIQEDVAVE